jgi:hypothetical protein
VAGADSAPAQTASNAAVTATAALDTTVQADVVSLSTVLLPGSYAWATTVALPAWSTPHLAPRFGALLALFFLVLGPWLARRRLVLGRALGVLGFLGLSAGTWGALGNSLATQHLDPVRAALGAVAWGFFALGWGSLRRADHVPERDPRAVVGVPLAPKQRLRAGVGLLFGLVVALGIALPLLAWRVPQDGVSLLAHALGLAAGIAVINVGSRVVLAGYERAPGPGKARAPRAFALLFLAWLVFGIVVWVL